MSTKISKIEKEYKKTEILAVANMDGDWRKLARTMDVPLSTAYRWVSEGETIDRRGGKRFQKIDKIHLDFFIEMIEKNSRITLAGLSTAFQERFNFVISKTTISKHLDALCYTLTYIRYDPEQGNSPENKQKRKEFVEDLLEFQAQNKPILFMGETNLNIHTSKPIKGTRCSTIAAGARGGNVYVLGCISTAGLIHYDLSRSSFKMDDARIWLKTCLRQAMVRHGQPVVIVVNNAPYNNQIEEVLQEKEFCENHILRLVPNSPMLNPIENVWPLVKVDVNRELSKKLSRICYSKTPLPIEEQRVQLLESLLEKVLETITPETCAKCFASIGDKFPAVRNLDNL